MWGQRPHHQCHWPALPVPDLGGGSFVDSTPLSSPKQPEFSHLSLSRKSHQSLLLGGLRAASCPLPRVWVPGLGWPSAFLLSPFPESPPIWLLYPRPFVVWVVLHIFGLRRVILQSQLARRGTQGGQSKRPQCVRALAAQQEGLLEGAKVAEGQDSKCVSALMWVAPRTSVNTNSSFFFGVRANDQVSKSAILGAGARLAPGPGTHPTIQEGLKVTRGRHQVGPGEAAWETENEEGGEARVKSQRGWANSDDAGAGGRR